MIWIELHELCIIKKLTNTASPVTSQPSRFSFTTRSVYLFQVLFCGILTCHFFTIDLSLSVVRFMPWKLVSTLRPWTSSAINLNFLKAISSFWRSAKEHSNTRPFNPSDAIPDNKIQFSIRSTLTVLLIFKRILFTFFTCLKLSTIQLVHQF